MKKSIIIFFLCCISFRLQADWEITIQNKTNKEIILSDAPSLEYGGPITVERRDSFWLRVQADSTNEPLKIRGTGSGSVKITNGYPIYTTLISSVSANIASLNASIVIPYTLNAYSPNMNVAYQAKLPWSVELKTPAGEWEIDAILVIPLNVNPQRYA